MFQFTRALMGVLLSLAVSQFSVPAVEIIAHRGASHDAPENTLSAMKLGWKQKADAVELDLWFSKDGKIIVFHDSTTKRYDGKARPIGSLTLAEARQLDVGTWKGEAFKGERIPSLESILETIPAGKRAVIEIKCGPEIVPELVRVLQGTGRRSNDFAVISFRHDTLAASKAALPAIEHYFLYGYEKDKKTGQLPELAPLIKRAKDSGFDGLNLHHGWPIDKAFVGKVKDAGLKMYVWTVDDSAVAQRLVDAGVDGITTNRPEWLRNQLKP